MQRRLNGEILATGCQLRNIGNIKVMIYVIEYEIIEKKMNLMLLVIIVKIKFEAKPKAAKI